MAILYPDYNAGGKKIKKGKEGFRLYKSNSSIEACIEQLLSEIEAEKQTS